MTGTELEALARQKYNAVSDTFFSSAEILDYLNEASQTMAAECLLIETYNTSTTTVASTQSYAFPTRVTGVKRVTYNGGKLRPINMREDDMLTLNNQATTSSGTPQYYWIWSDTIYLRPIPDGAQTLAIWGYKSPADLTAGGTSEIPTRFQRDLTTYALIQMCAKDQNYSGASYYKEQWEMALSKAKRWASKRKVHDAFPVVQDEESQAVTILGVV